MSKACERTRIAYDKGYRVQPDGTVLAPSGRTRKLRITAGSRRRVPYLFFTVKVGRDSVPVLVHRLASYQRFGERAFAVDATRHLDGDSLNNRWDNIALGTRRDNAMDRTPESRQAHARKAARVLRRFTDAEVRAIRAAHAAGEGYKKLVRRFGGSVSGMSYVIRRKLYADVV